MHLRKLQAEEFWPEDDEQEEERGISQIWHYGKLLVW